MVEKSTSETMAEAAGTEQLLTVTYQGGRAPGYKRRIMVRSVDGADMQVREFPGDLPRTYLLSRTTLVDDNYPAEWMPENAGKTVAVDPQSYFLGWAFIIEPCSFSALGVNPRYVIDQEKTQPAREQAMERGMTKKEATKHIKIMRREYAVGIPPAYDFHEGDIFYRGGYGSSDWLQILKIRSADTIQEIETHFPTSGGRVAFILSPEALEHLLKTGSAPPVEKQIPPSRSGSEAVRMLIKQPGLHE
jgi:hypothetical protein